MTAWMESGACRAAIANGEANRDDFFPDQYDSAAGQRAKAICAACPVKGACLAYAVETMQSGIWGGTNDKERRKLRPKVVDRACSECKTMFATPAGATGALTCGARCRDGRHQRLKRERRDAELTLEMYDQGHGLISRYSSGCRCPACRRVSREARARYREVVA